MSLTQAYTYYHGFNEAFYYLLATRSNPFTAPMMLGHPFYHLPPLYPSLVSVLQFMPTQAASRLPSLISYAGLTWILWKKGNLLYAATPILLLWMGRGQTDPTLTFMVVLVAWARNQQKPFLAGTAFLLGLLTKQTALLCLPLLLYWPGLRWRSRLLLTGLPLLASACWWLWQYSVSPQGVVEAWVFHSSQRSQPFEALGEVLIWGFLIGSMGLPWWRIGSVWNQARAESITALLFLLFAAWQAPWGHSYYALPAIGLLAYTLPPPRTTLPTLLSVAVGVFLLMDAGDLGPPILRDAILSIPDGTCIRDEWWPQATVLEKDDGPGCLPSAHHLGRMDDSCPNRVREWSWMMSQIILSHCPLNQTGGQER